MWQCPGLRDDSPLTCELVRARDLSVPVRRCLRDPLQRPVVDPHEPEPRPVSMRPLEVVEERPDEVAADVRPYLDRPVDGCHVAAQVVDPLRVVDATPASGSGSSRSAMPFSVTNRGMPG